MKLTDLSAQFLRVDAAKPGRKALVDTLAEANGIMFVCPLCFAAKGGKATGLADLTFVPPGAVSVLLKGGCGWHGFVKNGDAS